MQAAYYQEYYSFERTHWWFLVRKKILQDQIAGLFPDGRTLRILNVGAAWGASTLLLQEFGEVISVEYHKDCCDFARENLGLDFIQGSITELPFGDHQFDLICAFDVVEHVRDDRLAIAELHRVCKPGGYTFTTVPAFKALWSEHDVINEHVRRYTMRNYRALYDKKVSRIHFSTYFNFFLFPLIAVFRIGSSLLRSVRRKNKKGSPTPDNRKFDQGFISGILYRVFKQEIFFLKKGLRFPVGVSLLMISKKL